MAGTFDTEIAVEGNRWFAFAKVSGWGRRHSATTAARRTRYRWSTEDPGYDADTVATYIPALQLPPDILGEEIDFRKGVTLLGEFAFDLGDLPQPAHATVHGWKTTDLVTDLLAVEATPDAGPWKLAADVDKTSASWTLDDATGIAVNRHYWIGNEVVRVTSTAGAPVVVVDRAELGTRAQVHLTRANGGAGFIHDHPRHVRGRRVELYVNCYDSRTGAALDESEAKLVGIYLISDWETVDENTFGFVARPVLGALDKTVGRKQYSTVAGWNRQRDPYWTERGNESMVADLERIVTIRKPKPIAGYPVVEPQYLWSGGGDSRKQDFYARFGDQIVEVDYYRNTTDPPHATFRLQAFGLRPKDFVPESADDQNIPFRDVLLTHPTPRRVSELDYPNNVFQLGGETTVHPIDLLLAFITSTGDSPATNGDWDLPLGHWGAAVDVGDLNLATFEDLKQRTQREKMPGLVLGWEGQPVALRQWLEQNILQPLGWFLFQDDAGLIAIGEISEVYDTSGLPTIDEGDIVSGSARMAGQLDMTTTHQTYHYDRGPGGKFRQVWRHRHPEAEERYPEDNSDIVFEVDGFGQDDAEGLISRKATIFARRWHTPRPLVRLAVGLHRINLSLTDAVLLTCSTLPDPVGRVRGLVSRPAVIVSRGVTLAEGRIDLELVLVDNPNNGVWAPSGTVTAWDNGNKDVTLQANDFTADGAGDDVPERDALAFAVGDKVMLLDSDLQVRSDDLVTVSAVEPTAPGDNKLRLSGSFEFAAVPLTPNANDVVTYLHYESGGTPSSAWTAGMKLCVAEADDTDDELPNADGGYVYGG